MSDIRVRIAPSPTGNLHVGTARTALFNWLFARHTGGKFVLRIEDTDLERSEEKYTQNIYDSMKAIGLNWDEGPDIGGEFAPYKQSERMETYEKYANQLIKSGHAYYCYCTQEELEAEKELARQEKRDFVYSGRCKNSSPEEIEKFKAEGRKPVIRFVVPPEKLAFNDMIKGEIEFDMALSGDFVIMKSNGTAAYNFAVVVDDFEMKISHVIRGEDHISNTPKQILIYKALGVEVPNFAHLGMILAPDKSKLSKRHGATAVSEFIEEGYLSEAFVNFLALLGWSPSDEEEIKSIDEIIKQFELEKVSSSPAVFEFDKLNWMNGMYIRSMPIKEITNRAKKYLQDYDLTEYSEEKLQEIVEAVRKNLVKLNEIADSVSYFFGENVEVCEEIQQSVLDTDETKQVLPEFVKLAEILDYDDVEKLHEQLGEFRQQMKPIKPKLTMWAIRAALTGKTSGADIGSVISILGKDRVINRTQKAIS